MKKNILQTACQLNLVVVISCMQITGMRDIYITLSNILRLFLVDTAETYDGVSADPKLETRVFLFVEKWLGFRKKTHPDLEPIF